MLFLLSMRLDRYLVENKIFDSRNKASEAVLRGEIYVDNKMVDKPSKEISDLNIVSYVKNKSFVSLGGYKLDKALNDFSLDVTNLVCADIGSSTGGFTDCLLQRNAKKVFSVDLNDNLLHLSLKNNDKVVRIIKNAKLLTKNDFSCPIDLLTADLSFISETIILPILSNLIDDSGKIIVLIKPQFEMGRKVSLKKGILKDKNIRQDAVIKVLDCAKNCGLFIKNLTTAPIVKEKNIEYLALFTKNSNDIFNLNHYDFK